MDHRGEGASLHGPKGNGWEENGGIGGLRSTPPMNSPRPVCATGRLHARPPGAGGKGAAAPSRALGTQRPSSPRARLTSPTSPTERACPGSPAGACGPRLGLSPAPPALCPLLEGQGVRSEGPRPQRPPSPPWRAPHPHPPARSLRSRLRTRKAIGKMGCLDPPRHRQVCLERIHPA